MVMKVEMPYYGNLSVNKFKHFGTKKTRPEVEIWMRQLAGKVRGMKIEPPVFVKLFGKFCDNRTPDLANLHKVVGDALEKGLGINDKEFLFVDVGYSTGHRRPVLEITIEGVSDEQT